MSKLMQSLMKDIKADGDGKFGIVAKDKVMIKTGFDMLDYHNGYYTSDNKIKLGVSSSNMIYLIGKSGVGKTTFGIQVANSLISDFKNGSCFILDFESANSKDRVMAVTGLSDKEYDKKFSILQTGISTESVFQLVKKISETKKSMKDDIMVTRDGVEIYPPTVMLVDSIATMASGTAFDSNDESQSNMAGARNAKLNNELSRRINQDCKTYNIIMVMINHITAKVDTGRIKSAADVNYLKQDESLPGGKGLVYAADTLIKLTSSTKLKTDASFKVPGFKVRVTIVKSRTAPAGTEFSMIFDQNNGYDNILSNLQLLQDNKLVAGSGKSYHFPELTAKDKKYSFIASNFIEKLETHPPVFKAEFERLVKKTLTGVIRKPRNKYKN